MEDSRSQRARLALTGLSVGDAFGQQFFYPGVLETASPEKLPAGPWNYTDDTAMAMGVVQTLEHCAEIDQDALALTFAERHFLDPHRGYGAGARQLLNSIHRGSDWRTESPAMFGGSGSYGNGAAMRVAPLGAWFADDVEQLIAQATRSAEVTHAHREGVVGAVAVALATAWAYRRRTPGDAVDESELLPWVIERLEDSQVRSRLEWAATYPLDTWPFTVASQVGNGLQISAQDTVPFCLWLAASRIDDYCDAMWMAARIGGDIDTNCAIICGIIAMNVGRSGIPENWIQSREELKW